MTYPSGSPKGFSATLDDLDRLIIMDPLAFNEVRNRPSLEEQLEKVISGASLMVSFLIIIIFFQFFSVEISV